MARCKITRPGRFPAATFLRHCVTIIACWLLLTACPNEKEKPEPQPDAVPVRVRPLVAQRHVIEKTFVGEVRPWREISLSCQIGGLIVGFDCEKGDRVTSGQRLAQIDDRDLRFDLRDAEQRVVELEQQTSKTRSLTRPQVLRTLLARCAQCDANLRKAQLEYERATQLLANGVTAKSQFDQAEAAFRAALAEQTVSREDLKLAEEGARIEDIRAAESQLERARVAVERARKRLADARVVAPADALVVRRYGEIGELVRPGEPMLDLVETDRVKILLYVAEQDVVRFGTGQEVNVVADALGDRRFRGQICFVGDVADLRLRTFEVEIAVANGDLALKPGMVARVTAVMGEVEQALAIPETLVAEREGRKGFFYVDGETAAFFPLDAAVRDGDRWIVRAPDSPQVPAIETRTTRLAPGVRIRVVEQQDSAR